MSSRSMLGRATGHISVVGVYQSEDPGASTKDAVKLYNRELRDSTTDGRASPGFIVSHELPLEEARDAFRHFDARDDGWT